MGYPDIMLIKNIYPDIAGASNNFFVMGEIYLQKGDKKSSSASSLLKTKKGNNAGTTAVAQTINPFVTDCIYFVGFKAKIAMHKTINNEKNKLTLFLLTFCIIIFMSGGKAL